MRTRLQEKPSLNPDFSDILSAFNAEGVEGIEVPILGRQELLKNKRAVGRPQDKADISRLERQGE